MFGDIFVRLEPLISKNQKFFKSTHTIALDHNPTIIFNFLFWQDRRKCSGTFLCGLSPWFQKTKNYLNPLTPSLSTIIRPKFLIFCFDKIEESVRGHFCAAWAPDFKKQKIFKIRLSYPKINDFLNQTFHRLKFFFDRLRKSITVFRN